MPDNLPIKWASSTICQGFFAMWSIKECLPMRNSLKWKCQFFNQTKKFGFLKRYLKKTKKALAGRSDVHWHLKCWLSFNLLLKLDPIYDLVFCKMPSHYRTRTSEEGRDGGINKQIFSNINLFQRNWNSENGSLENRTPNLTKRGDGMMDKT